MSAGTRPRCPGIFGGKPTRSRRQAERSREGPAGRKCRRRTGSRPSGASRERSPDATASSRLRLRRTIRPRGTGAGTLRHAGAAGSLTARGGCTVHRPLRRGRPTAPPGRSPPAARSGPGRNSRFQVGGSPRAASAESSPAASSRRAGRSGGGRGRTGAVARAERRTVRSRAGRVPRGRSGSRPPAAEFPSPAATRHGSASATGGTVHGDRATDFQREGGKPGEGRVRSVRGGRPPSGEDHSESVDSHSGFPRTRAREGYKGAAASGSPAGSARRRRQCG